MVNTAVNGKLPLTVWNPIHNRLYIIINFKIYKAMLPTLTDSWVTWPYWHWPCPVTLILILITGICPDLDDLDQTWQNPALIRMVFLREWICLFTSRFRFFAPCHFPLPWSYPSILTWLWPTLIGPSSFSVQSLKHSASGPCGVIIEWRVAPPRSTRMEVGATTS